MESLIVNLPISKLSGVRRLVKWSPALRSSRMIHLCELNHSILDDSDRAVRKRSHGGIKMSRSCGSRASARCAFSDECITAFATRVVHYGFQISIARGGSGAGAAEHAKRAPRREACITDHEFKNFRHRCPDAGLRPATRSLSMPAKQSGNQLKRLPWRFA
jgi:hypothetical protein